MGDTLIGSSIMPSDLQIQPLGNSTATLPSTGPDQTNLSGASNLVPAMQQQLSVINNGNGNENNNNKNSNSNLALQTSKPYPGLQVAVEHLLELAEVMTSEEYGFKDEDILRIDEVIETLEAMEAEKRQLHDQLETASIRAATLRSR